MPAGPTLPLLRFLLVVLTLMAPAFAHAAPFATIDQISVMDPRGRWGSVTSTGRATVNRDGQALPVTLGLELAPGDRVVTEAARVRVRLGIGQDISVDEHADVEVRERSVLQRIGEAYYRVRGAFSVTYGNVETSVDGTEFSVATGPLTVVTVAEGRVRVTNGETAVLVRRGEVVELPQSGSGGPARFDPSSVRRSTRKTFQRAEPAFQGGGLVAGGLANGGPAVEGRLFARVLLLPGLRLAVDAGLGSDGAEEGLRMPAGLGLEFDLGGAAAGGELLTTVETCNFECGGAYVALHLGAVGFVRYGLPLSRALSLEGIVRAGYADGIVADAGLGLAVSR